MSSEFQRLLAAGEARIQYGNDERTAGADDKARAIAAEVERRGHGGARQLATELGVSEKTISTAVSRARRAPAPSRQLPPDTLERLLEAEAATVQPLSSTEWEALAWIVRGTVIDVVWVGQAGELLAQEVEDADLPDSIDTKQLAAACRSWTPGQGMAVIDACQQDALGNLPVKDR
jgi:hypothetical protein